MNNSISGLIGSVIAVMILFNGTLATAYGNYTSSVIIHFTGLISILIVLLTTRKKFKIHKGIPIYLFSAGTIGVFTILLNNASFNALGVSLTIALGLLGQSITSIIIDHFGLLDMKCTPFEKKKMIGLLLIVLGIVIMTIYY